MCGTISNSKGEQWEKNNGEIEQRGQNNKGCENNGNNLE